MFTLHNNDSGSLLWNKSPRKIQMTSLHFTMVETPLGRIDKEIKFLKGKRDKDQLHYIIIKYATYALPALLR